MRNRVVYVEGQARYESRAPLKLRLLSNVRVVRRDEAGKITGWDARGMGPIRRFIADRTAR